MRCAEQSQSIIPRRGDWSGVPKETNKCQPKPNGGGGRVTGTHRAHPGGRRREREREWEHSSEDKNWASLK